MEYSQNGFALTEKHEGLRLQAYRDTGNVWTIGYGHTKGVKSGDTITKDQAVAFLNSDVKEAADAVNGLVTIPITQNQFDALVDFTFNVGRDAFSTSTLLKYLNTGDYKGAGLQFQRWKYDNGKIEPGLVARRADETALFLHM